MLRVRIGGVVFSGHTNDGFLIGPSGFSGWDSGVGIRRESVERPQAHGSFDLPGFLDSRVVTLAGDCLADSEERLGWYRSQLAGLGAQGESFRVAVDHHGMTLYADARLAAATEFDVRGGRNSATYQIQLWFANPRKYGQTRVFASGVAAYHSGNFPAAPVFTVTGARSGYTIPGPSGKAFIVTRAIVGSEVHTVDMADGFLRVNGAVVSGGVSQADTWTVAGGGQVTHTLSGLTTTVRDTFI